MEVGIIFYMCVRAKLLQWCPVFETLLTVPGDYQGQNTGVRCHVIPQGDFPTQGSNSGLSCLSCIVGGFFTTSTSWEAQYLI